MADAKTRLRASLLRLLPRSLLEGVSSMERPWTADRKSLEQHVLTAWNDDTYDVVMAFIKDAK